MAHFLEEVLARRLQVAVWDQGHILKLGVCFGRPDDYAPPTVNGTGIALGDALGEPAFDRVACVRKSNHKPPLDVDTARDARTSTRPRQSRGPHKFRM